MPVCTIIYNSSSGSDTAASGGNAPTTAVTGTNGDVSSTTFTLNETADFSGVADDDSDVLWINTPTTERHLFRITAFTGGVSTCTALTITPAADAVRTADSWAVGGLRATLDNDTGQPDLEDGLAGWRFELQGTGLAYPIAQTNTLPAVGDFTSGPFELAAASGATPNITWTGDFAALTLPASCYLRLEGVTFTGSSSTSQAQRSISCNASDVFLEAIGCTFSQYGQALWGNNTTRGWIRSCDLTSTATQAIELSGRANMLILGNTIHNCGADGINIDASSGLSAVRIISNIIRDNADSGIEVDVGAGNQMTDISNNVIHDNAADGISLNTAMSVTHQLSIYNNIFTENGAYAIDSPTSGSDMNIFNDYNAFRNNTSGNHNNLTAGANDVTLSADPYTTVGSDDYSLNATAGGGAACKDVGIGRTV